jgi:hypothetical protein
VLARMYEDLLDLDGDAELRHLDRAIEAYPDTLYARPSAQSYFQHLVNQKAMLIWKRDGFAAARDLALELFTSDERFRYFFSMPWKRALDVEMSVQERLTDLADGAVLLGLDAKIVQRHRDALRSELETRRAAYDELIESVLEGYEVRAERFPDQAETARQYAEELREAHGLD